MSHPDRIIEIIVSPDGQTRLETKGFAGSSCRDASKSLEKALGQVAGEQLTPEFYVKQSAHQENRTRQ